MVHLVSALVSTAAGGRGGSRRATTPGTGGQEESPTPDRRDAGHQAAFGRTDGPQ